MGQILNFILIVGRGDPTHRKFDVELVIVVCRGAHCASANLIQRNVILSPALFRKEGGVATAGVLWNLMQQLKENTTSESAGDHGSPLQKTRTDFFRPFSVLALNIF